MAEILYANGALEARVPAKGKRFTLEELQAIVGGYIGIFQLPDHRFMVLGEESALADLPLNRAASELVTSQHVDIVGDVLVCRRAEL